MVSATSDLSTIGQNRTKFSQCNIIAWLEAIRAAICGNVGFSRWSGRARQSVRAAFPRPHISPIRKIAFDMRVAGGPIGILHLVVISNHVELASDGFAVAECRNKLRALKSFR